MFKKPLANLKTSAPLRGSDRRKLKQRVVDTYDLTSEEGDVLVPDGILSAKLMTHGDEPGMVYTAPSGDPLWFTIGKGSDDLIPAVYTLWKKQDLLPFLSTPRAVIPILIGGADLMIPGVIHCPPNLDEGRLVSIRQYTKVNDKPALSAPVAIGRMAVPSNALRGSEGKEKGKAVLVLHTWKDHLWDHGAKTGMPEDTVITNSTPAPDPIQDDSSDHENVAPEPVPGDASLETKEGPSQSGRSSAKPDAPQETVTYSSQEVTDLLNKALVHAIATSLGALPASSFPISATVLYTNHILPSRPAFPHSVVPPTDWIQNSSSEPPQISTDITIKTSTHKSLTTFLKAAEKTSLLTLKAPPKQADILVTSVNSNHPFVKEHKPFVTVKDIELTAAKKVARQEKELQDQRATSGQLEIKELWKPHTTSIDLCEAMGASKNELYNAIDIRNMVNSYISSHQLVNPRDQAYINLDDALYGCVSSKSSNKGKKPKDGEPEPELSRFMKRDELMRKIVERMQAFYEIRAEGKDPVVKKGTLLPVQVVMKMRQGRKACTLITGFEPYPVINADEMAEELRKTCAGATSVNPVPGKPAGSAIEVMVQGKQSKAVTDYLLAKGIPKKWIEVSDLVGKK